jgi:hypothetical protein
MDPRLRGDDNEEGFSTFYETIIIGQHDTLPDGFHER